ncbi:hypothetical protein D3C72_1876390 [compost metagenome]
MQRTLHRAVNQPAPRIATQHRRRGLHRRHDAVIRRSGGVHHIGLVKGTFVIVTLNVDHRGLRKRRQQFVSRLGFVDHFTGYTFPAHAALAVINRMEIGIGHPGGIKMN